MTANELRIGNWVMNYEGVPYRITPRFFSSISGGLTWDEQVQAGHSELNHTVNPIPLTPEILEKCGFYKITNQYQDNWVLPHRHDESGYSVMFRNGSYWFCNDAGDAWCNVICEVGSLHQLQNIHFALTGEELTVNL